MHIFEDSVPFDPGFSPLSFSFVENITVANSEFSSLKANHQKKFWLTRAEGTILDYINKSAAFYLGCMLWGGFIHCRFKNNPKPILGNNTDSLTEQEKSEIDCAIEVKAILEYIKSFDRNMKYFLNKPAKVPPYIIEILTNYIEFAKLNNNFLNISKTEEIKLPSLFEHFESLSEEKLDAICEKIYAVIDSGKIENLLQIDILK